MNESVTRRYLISVILHGTVSWVSIGTKTNYYRNSLPQKAISNADTQKQKEKKEKKESPLNRREKITPTRLTSSLPFPREGYSTATGTHGPGISINQSTTQSTQPLNEQLQSSGTSHLRPKLLQPLGPALFSMEKSIIEKHIKKKKLK